MELLGTRRAAQGVAFFEQLDDGCRTKFAGAVDAAMVAGHQQRQVAAFAGYPQAFAECLAERRASGFVTDMPGQDVGRRQCLAQVVAEGSVTDR